MRSPFVTVLLASALFATPVAAATLTRGPYLQLMTGVSVTVVWNTDSAAACALAIRPLDGPTTVRAGSTGTVCAIAVDGLTPGTALRLHAARRRRPARRPSRSSGPTTRAVPFTFLVVGDSGCASTAQLAVRDRMLDDAGRLHPPHRRHGLRRAARPRTSTRSSSRRTADLLRRLVFWPTLGNHDVADAGDEPWRDAFYTPANNPARQRELLLLRLRQRARGRARQQRQHKPGSAQYAFLDQDLAASTATLEVRRLPPHHLLERHDARQQPGRSAPTSCRSSTRTASTSSSWGTTTTTSAPSRCARTRWSHRGRAPSTSRPAAAGATSTRSGRAASPRTRSRRSTSRAWRSTATRCSPQMIRDDGTIGDTVTLLEGGGPAPAGVRRRPRQRPDGAVRRRRSRRLRRAVRRRLHVRAGVRRRPRRPADRGLRRGRRRRVSGALPLGLSPAATRRASSRSARWPTRTSSRGRRPPGTTVPPTGSRPPSSCRSTSPTSSSTCRG